MGNLRELKERKERMLETTNPAAARGSSRFPPYDRFLFGFVVFFAVVLRRSD